MGVIHHFKGKEGSWDWEDVAVADYGAARPNVTVRRFISRKENSSNMELRYFELGPGATSNHESHNYEHAVLVLRGRGTVRIGEEISPIQFGDAVFIGSSEVHQFRAAADGCLGFLCAVLDKELRVKVHGEQHLDQFA